MKLNIQGLRHEGSWVHLAQETYTDKQNAEMMAASYRRVVANYFDDGTKYSKVLLVGDTVIDIKGFVSLKFTVDPV